MKIKSIENITGISGKKIILRVDWNVKNEYLNNISQTRIKNSLKSIAYLHERKAQIIIISHKGRPNGTWQESETLYPVIEALNKQTEFTFELINQNVLTHTNQIKNKIADTKNDTILVLENIRFYQEELDNNQDFAKIISEFGDIYINDAFSTCHRAQASVASISNYVPAYAGFTILNEIKHLQKVINPPDHSVILFGGAKLETKLAAIDKLAAVYEYVLTGSVFGKIFQDVISSGPHGKLAVNIKSELINYAHEIYRKYHEKLILPDDYIVSQGLEQDSMNFVKKYDTIQSSEYILDVGPQTIQKYTKYLKSAQMIVWNGPLGFYENPSYQHSTRALGNIIASRSSKVFTVIGGGDTISVVYDLNIEQDIDFISTGGGAMLEYLYHQNLPGLTHLFK